MHLLNTTSYLSSPSPWSGGVPTFSLFKVGAAVEGSWMLAIFWALSDSGDATAGELEFAAVATFGDATLAVAVLEVTGEEFAADDFDGLQQRKQAYKFVRTYISEQYYFINILFMYKWLLITKFEHSIVRTQHFSLFLIKWFMQFSFFALC